MTTEERAEPMRQRRQEQAEAARRLSERVSTRRVRLTITASYRTDVSTATVTLSETSVVDHDASRDELIDVMKASLRAHARRLGDPIVGDIDVRRFEVEYL